MAREWRSWELGFARARCWRSDARDDGRRRPLHRRVEGHAAETPSSQGECEAFVRRLRRSYTSFRSLRDDCASSARHEGELDGERGDGGGTAALVSLPFFLSRAVPARGGGMKG